MPGVELALFLPFPSLPTFFPRFEMFAQQIIKTILLAKTKSTENRWNKKILNNQTTRRTLIKYWRNILQQYTRNLYLKTPREQESATGKYTPGYKSRKEHAKQTISLSRHWKQRGLNKKYKKVTFSSHKLNSRLRQLKFRNIKTYRKVQTTQMTFTSNYNRVSRV